MAFGFNFGGDKSIIGKLASGKLKEEEKQALLTQLTQAAPGAEELVPLISLDDQGIASRAAQLFLNKADQGGVNALVEDMLTRGTGFATAMKVLQKCREELVVRMVEANLARPRPDVARKLWELILELPSSISDKYLERALAEAPGSSRLTALRRLIKARGAEAMRALLIECSSNRELVVRKEAVTVLATLAGEDVFGVMLDRLTGDDSKEIRDYAGTYLKQYIAKAPPEVKPRVLGRLLLAGEPDQRKQLVQSMFSGGERDDLLVGVLGFCKQLTGIQHRTVMDALKSVGEGLLQPTVGLLKSPDADMRVQAVYLLETYADPRTVGPLVAMLRDSDWWVRIVVCEAVGRLKEPKTIPALKELFSDSDAKWAAIEAVGRIGGEPAATTLMPLLGDPTAEVRSMTVTTLRTVKDPRVEQALTQVTTKDPSVDVRLKAVEILREMKGDLRGGTGMVISSKDLTKPLEKMLAYLRERNGSDLHITPGEPPIIRVNGTLERVQSGKMEPEHTKQVLSECLDPVRMPMLEKDGAVDFCYGIPGVGRYRANVFKMKRGYAGVFRAVPNIAPTFADLGLPKHLSDIGTFHQGIVLVTGAAGSGKTTTMTALVNTINESRFTHVISFEDPIEFVHTPKKALINQREIGKDTASYAAAIRGALREDPDVIVVGDMRDPETIRLALLASETGHLVVATMQTTGAAPTIDKLVESFPPDEHQQVRVSLSESLKLIVSQVLVPRADGQGRCAIFEVLKSTTSVRSLIRDGKTFQLPSTMTIGRSIGMQTIDGALEERLKQGMITFETAMAYAQNKEAFAKSQTGGGPGAPGVAPPAASPPVRQPGVAGAVGQPMQRPSAPAAAGINRPGAPAGAGMNRPSAPTGPAAVAGNRPSSPGAPAASPSAPSRPTAPGTPGRKV
jgi:twitching motility protein PilT